MELRRRARPVTSAAVLAAGCLALAAGLSGCSPSGPDGAAPAATAPAGTEGTAGPQTAAPPSVPGVTDALEAELGKVAAAGQLPDRAAMVRAFASAGFPESAVEVSVDRTPTGLEVDSMQAAALRDGECIFGEVREGKASVTALPVLSDGGCFVGD